MPLIALATTGDNQALEIDPGFPYQVRFLIIIEDRDLQLVIIERLMNCEAELLVPTAGVSIDAFEA